MDMDEMQAGIDNDAEARRIAALIDEAVDTDEQKRERHRASVTVANKKKAQDPAWREASAKANAKTAQDPAWREAIAKMAQDPAWREANAKAMAKRSKDQAWREANAKAMAKRQKPIVCIETKVIYKGASDALMKTDIDRSSIASVCNGHRATAGGYHWRYATPEEVEKFRSQSVHGAD